VGVRAKAAADLTGPGGAWKTRPHLKLDAPTQVRLGLQRARAPRTFAATLSARRSGSWPWWSPIWRRSDLLRALIRGVRDREVLGSWLAAELRGSASGWLPERLAVSRLRCSWAFYYLGTTVQGIAGAIRGGYSSRARLAGRALPLWTMLWTRGMEVVPPSIWIDGWVGLGRRCG